MPEKVFIFSLVSFADAYLIIQEQNCWFVEQYLIGLIYWVASVLLVQQNKNGILGTRSAKKYCSSLKI